MNGNDIVMAICKLRDTYPTERISLWCDVGPTDGERYTATVGTSDAAYGYGQTPMESVECLIKRAGKRDPEQLRQQKINKLRDELAKLEAAQTPVVMES